MDDLLLYAAPSGVYAAVFHQTTTQTTTHVPQQLRVTATVDTADTNRAHHRWTLTCAIPWQILAVTPHAGLTLGMELYLVDRDGPAARRVISGWSSPPNNHLNPTEWGTLHCELGDTFKGSPIAIVAVVLCAIAILALFFRRRKGVRHNNSETVEQEPSERSAQEVLVAQAQQFIAQNFSDENINRTMIAKSLHVSSGYLSSWYARIAGESLKETITRHRIEQAQTLLKKGDLNISQIALRVGFSSVNHFIRTFKAHKQITPKQFQIHHRK